MFSHGRSLTSLLVVFFALLFIPVVGPFLTILVLVAGGNALSSRSKREQRRIDKQKQYEATYAARKAEFEAEIARKAQRKIR